MKCKISLYKVLYALVQKFASDEVYHHIDELLTRISNIQSWTIFELDTWKHIKSVGVRDNDCKLCYRPKEIVYQSGDIYFITCRIYLKQIGRSGWVLIIHSIFWPTKPPSILELFFGEFDSPFLIAALNDWMNGLYTFGRFIYTLELPF